MSRTAADIDRDRHAGAGGNKLVAVLGVIVALLLAAIALFFVLGGDLDVDADAEVDAPNVDVQAPDVDVDPGGVDVEEDEADLDPGS